MGVYGHIHANVTACFLNENLFFDYYHDSHAIALDINSYSLVIQFSLNTMGYMVHESTCADNLCTLVLHLGGTLYILSQDVILSTILSMPS